MGDFFHFVAPFNVTYELFQQIRFHDFPLPTKVSLENEAIHLHEIDFSSDMIQQQTQVWYEFIVEKNGKENILKEKLTVTSNAFTKKDAIELLWDSVITDETIEKLFEHMLKEYIVLDWGKIDGVNKCPIELIKKTVKPLGTYFRERFKEFDKIQIQGLSNAVYLKGSNSGHIFLSPVPTTQEYIKSSTLNNLKERTKKGEWHDQNKLIHRFYEDLKHGKVNIIKKI